MFSWVRKGRDYNYIIIYLASAIAVLCVMPATNLHQCTINLISGQVCRWKWFILLNDAALYIASLSPTFSPTFQLKTTSKKIKIIFWNLLLILAVESFKKRCKSQNYTFGSHWLKKITLKQAKQSKARVSKAFVLLMLLLCSCFSLLCSWS